MAKKKTEEQLIAAAEPTPSERLHTLRSILHHKIETSRECVDTLAKDLTNPERFPLEVLSWSARAFEAAAVLQIAQEITERLDAGASIVDIHLGLQRDALRGARGGWSSSPTSNFATACRTAALAEFEEFLRYDAAKAKAEVRS